MAKERTGQEAKGLGSVRARERIGQVAIGLFAPGSKLARKRKGSVTLLRSNLGVLINDFAQRNAQRTADLICDLAQCP